LNPTKELVFLLDNFASLRLQPLSSPEPFVILPKILLVDDVDFFLEMEKDFLRNTPANIHTARNGKEALEFVSRQRPDVIFMDVTMPVMDGITCCRILKADPELRSIPIIMVFAPSRELFPEAVAAAGCDACLTKPVDRKAFLEAGRRFLFGIERRDFRVPCQIPVTLRRQGVEIRCISEDLGERGMYIKSLESLAEGEVVRATLALPGGTTTEIECRVRVSWVNQGFPRTKLHLPQGFGVEFLQPSQATMAMIRSYLDKKKGKDQGQSLCGGSKMNNPH
jgi:CheY-like chemotaxis protein